jgi:hypothetical protein
MPRDPEKKESTFALLLLALFLHALFGAAAIGLVFHLI